MNNENREIEIIVDKKLLETTNSSNFTKKSLKIENMEQAVKFAEGIAKSSFCPECYKDKDKKPKTQDIALAVIYGLEMGLTPFASINNIAIIKGKPCLWGDGLKAIIYNTGLLKYLKEDFEGKFEDGTLKAVVKVARKDIDIEITSEFSLSEAKTAGLYPGSSQFDSTWKKYPKRMLMNRARTYALRDCFGDILLGMNTAEEVEEIQENKQIINVNDSDIVFNSYEEIKEKLLNTENEEELNEIQNQYTKTNLTLTQEEKEEMFNIIKNKKETFKEEKEANETL